MTDPFKPHQPLDPETAKARHGEQVRRFQKVQRLARRALARAHPEEYRELMRQARVIVDAEKGPLPGDEEVT